MELGCLELEVLQTGPNTIKFDYSVLERGLFVII